MSLTQFTAMLIVMGLAVSVTMDLWDYIHSDDRSRHSVTLMRKLWRKIRG